MVQYIVRTSSCGRNGIGWKISRRPEPYARFNGRFYDVPRGQGLLLLYYIIYVHDIYSLFAGTCGTHVCIIVRFGFRLSTRHIYCEIRLETVKLSARVHRTAYCLCTLEVNRVRWNRSDRYVPTRWRIQRQDTRPELRAGYRIKSVGFLICFVNKYFFDFWYVLYVSLLVSASVCLFSKNVTVIDDNNYQISTTSRQKCISNIEYWKSNNNRKYGLCIKAFSGQKSRRNIML